MKKSIIKLVLSGMFLALGIVLPFLTMQIPQIGSMMLPMHIPVLLCGFICGWPYGLIVGLITPVLRSFMFGMPPLMPTATAMAFELATYGAMTGLLFGMLRKVKFPSIVKIYCSLIIAMLAGRAVWGVVTLALMGVTGKSFTFAAFLGGAFINAVPGIIVQLVLIPILIFALQRAGLIPIDGNASKK